MDDETLLREFEDRTLPFEEWTHRAHVRVGYLYLTCYPFPEALERVRKGIQAYNAANGVNEGPTSGYNETTTQAFLRIIAGTIQSYGALVPTPDSESFCEAHPQVMTRQVLRLFYSPEQRSRPEAKSQFVEPDLAPLPALRNDGGTPAALARPEASADGATTAAEWATILRSELDAEDGSFLLRLRCELVWDDAAFARLTGAMEACCAAVEGCEQVERWQANGFWYLSWFVRDWVGHPSFPRQHADEHYASACSRLEELAYWFFFGESARGSGEAE